MLTIYLCFLAGGAVLPFMSFIMGSLSDGADTDLNSDVDLSSHLDIHSELGLHSGMDVHSDIDVHSGMGMDSGMDIHSDMNMDIYAGGNVSEGANHSIDKGSSVLSIGLIPTSLLSISALAITFGAVGALMTLGNLGKIVSLISAAILSYLVSVVIQTILQSLKKVQKENMGVNEHELLLYDGKVIDTILPGQMGTISFITLEKIRLSYPARCADKSLKLEIGRTVKVKEYVNGVFIVEPKNKYEEDAGFSKGI